MGDEPLPPGEYFVLAGEEPDEKRVSYRLIGEELDPAAITRLTGIEPKTAYRKGGPRPGTVSPARGSRVDLVAGVRKPVAFRPLWETAAMPLDRVLEGWLRS